MKVVLLGYMASGKSSVGRALAKRLNCDFLDLDEEISRLEKMSIPEIFSKRGEIYFRKKETEILAKILKYNSSMVLSLGGGTPCYGNNMELVAELADFSIYLKLSISELVERISIEKEQRPLVAGIPDEDLPEFIGKHLFERSPFYSLAKNTLVVEGKSIKNIVSEIAGLLV